MVKLHRKSAFLLLRRGPGCPGPGAQRAGANFRSWVCSQSRELEKLEMTPFTQGPLPRSIFLELLHQPQNSLASLSHVGHCVRKEGKNMLLAGDFFPVALHHPPYSFHCIACGISLPNQDIYYTWHLKILYAATWVNFLRAGTEDVDFFADS